MTLRPAQISDASSIAALSLEVWISTYLKHGVSAFFADYVLNTFTTSNTEKFIADPSEFVMVSQNDEGIDGYIRVSAGSKPPVNGCSDLQIATFYVQPRHHGKGIGSRLLDAALGHCRAMQAGTVWLTTNAENAHAIAFYLRKGFEHVGETHFRIGTESYLNNVYSYRLN